MAVISVKTMHDGWTGTQTKDELPSFSVVHLVEVDDPEDGVILVSAASGIPQIGTPYVTGNDANAFTKCNSISATPVTGTRNLWQVTCSFGHKKPEENEDPTDGIDVNGDPTDDPMEFAVSMTMGTTRVTRDGTMGVYIGQLTELAGGASVFDKDASFYEDKPVNQRRVKVDRNGRITNDVPVTNSVFKPFDPPPQIEYNREALKIKFNTLNSPVRLPPYVNSVNSKEIFISVLYKWTAPNGNGMNAFANVHIPQYCGRILALNTTPARRNGVAYHENNLEIEIDRLYTWRMDILDRGYSQIDIPKTQDYVKGQGFVVRKSTASEDGFEDREPTLLDGKGQELDVLVRSGVFLRYAMYPEMDWNVVGINNPIDLQGVN